MTTATVSEDQKLAWDQAVTEFVQEVYKQYPKLSDNWTTELVEEVKALGLGGAYISLRSLRACFRNAVADGRITVPQKEAVLTPEALEKLRASFPPVIKTIERQLSQKEKSAMAGIHPTSSLNHAKDDREIESSHAKSFATMRSVLAEQNLRREYLERKGRAEALRENTHARTYAARAKALKELNSNSKYQSVKD